MKEQTAEWINRLGRFCGKRDVPELTPDQLYRKYQIRQADVLALFGGSILCGGDVLADAMKQNVAKKYVIVGGAGHTTETLRRKMHAEFSEIMTEGLPEAEIFEAYLEYRYGLHADLLECRSTNCGNNITCLLELLAENGISFHSIILIQDAAMQRRMDAGLRKQDADAPDGYGPAGKNFIVHVDIPPEVAEAFSELKKEYGGMVREANPMYAS